jgi:hypothetical protein
VYVKRRMRKCDVCVKRMGAQVPCAANERGGGAVRWFLASS